ATPIRERRERLLMAGTRPPATLRAAAPDPIGPLSVKGRIFVRLQPPPGFSLPHRFGSSPPFTLGAEEELFLVTPTAQIARCTDAVLARMPRFTRGRVVGELCDGVVELVTPVCQDVTEVGRR